MEIVPVKLSDKEFVAIKCSVTPPASNSNNEYEVAQYEADTTRKILDLMRDLQNDVTTLNKAKDDFTLYKLNMPDHVILTAMSNKIFDSKKTRLHWLKIESNLLQYDSKIKAALTLDKANPREALEYMELMLKLDVSPLMLKKHPHVMDMARRLRKYIGNVDEWDMRGDELQEFLKDAETIRKKADEVFVKFGVRLDLM